MFNSTTCTLAIECITQKLAVLIWKAKKANIKHNTQLTDITVSTNQNPSIKNPSHIHCTTFKIAQYFCKSTICAFAIEYTTVKWATVSSAKSSPKLACGNMLSPQKHTTDRHKHHHESCYFINIHQEMLKIHPTYIVLPLKFHSISFNQPLVH